MTIKIDADKYPNIARVCDACDVGVMTDRDIAESPCPECQGRRPEMRDCPYCEGVGALLSQGDLLYYVAAPGEMSAGIYPCILSDTFDSMADLEAWALKVPPLETDDQVEAFIAGGWEKVF